MQTEVVFLEFFIYNFKVHKKNAKFALHQQTANKQASYQNPLKYNMFFFNCKAVNVQHRITICSSIFIKTSFVVTCFSFLYISKGQSYESTKIDSSSVYQHALANDAFIIPITSASINDTNQFFRTDTTVLTSTIKPINKKRLWLMAGGISATLGATYIYANNAWWNGEKTAFHLDRDETSASVFNIFHGRDFKYAKNIDKLAHFYGGVIFSEFFASQLRSANFPDKKAGLYGALMSTAVQGFIEVKDGTAPRWGFSVLDVVSGSLGGFYTYAQNYVPALAATDVKMSYYKRDDYYFTVPQANAKPSWADDYMNMTFWFSYNPARLLRQGKQVHPKWPKWLCISTCFGVDNTLNSYYTG